MASASIFCDSAGVVAQLLLPQLQPKPYLPSHTAGSLEAGSSLHPRFAAMDQRKCDIHRTKENVKDP